MARVSRAWLKRVATQTLIFSLAPVGIVVLRTAGAVTSARQLEWFPRRLSCGGTPPPGCEALVHLTIGACLAPLVVVAVIGVGLVTQAPDQLWRASSGKVVLTGALVVAAAPTVVLHSHPAWIRSHPTLWLVGPYALLLMLGALAALWATDDEDNRMKHLRHPAFEHLWRRLSALRLHIAVDLVYVVAILFLPQSSGQALDTLRSWGAGSVAAAATTLLGISTCLLLSFCLLGTAEPAEAVVDTEHDGDAASARRPFDGPVWLVVGVAIMVLGFVLARWGPLGLGILALGLVVFVLGRSPWCPWRRRPHRTGGAG